MSAPTCGVARPLCKTKQTQPALGGQYSPILSHPKCDKQWASQKMSCDVTDIVFSQFRIEGGAISSGPGGQTSTVLMGRWFHLLFPIRDTEGQLCQGNPSLWGLGREWRPSRRTHSVILPKWKPGEEGDPTRVWVLRRSDLR